MTEQIIDFLEMVQINAKHGKAVARVPATLRQHGKPRVQRGAIGQVRQQIVRCQVPDLLLGAIALGHILVGGQIRTTRPFASSTTVSDSRLMITSLLRHFR